MMTNPLRGTSNGQSPPGPRGSGGLRWKIVWTLFASTAINYLSRQTFSALTPVITVRFHLTHQGLAEILAAFQISYAIMSLLGGVFLDAIGSRIGLSVAVIFWSAANIMTVFAASPFEFAFFRFLLGIGEALTWPGASKVVGEWFPSRERGLAVAIFDSGSSLGGAMAAAIVPMIAVKFGWRSAFIFSGLLGFAWVLVWLRVYHPFDQHPRLMPDERLLVQAGRSEQPPPSRDGRWWSALATNRNVWGFVLSRALTDAVWWFYVFWLPQYLSDARGFGLSRIAAFAWIPFIAADVGNFTGGLMSSYCIRRGLSAVHARKWVCCVSCLPILAGIPASLVHNAPLAITLICFALLGCASWSTMGLALPSDLFPQNVVATVTGFSGLVAGLLGASFTFAVGILVDRVSYVPIFFLAGLLPVLATACLVFMVQPLPMSPTQE
jgi:ACS family hexuronate transporter-like MFS transporter